MGAKELKLYHLITWSSQAFDQKDLCGFQSLSKSLRFESEASSATTFNCYGNWQPLLSTKPQQVLMAAVCQLCVKLVWRPSMAGITGTQTEVLKGRASLFLADLRSSIPTLVTLIILTYLLIGFILEIVEPSRPNQTTPHWTMLWSRSGRGTLPNHTKTNQAQFLQCFLSKLRCSQQTHLSLSLSLS